MKKEGSAENPASLWVLGALSCAALNRPPLICVQTLSIERVTLFQSLELLGILLQENSSIHQFCCQTKRMLVWELLLFQIKARTRRWWNHRYQVGAACRLCYNELSGLIPQPWVVCPPAQAWRARCVWSTAQDEPGPTQVGCYMDHQLHGEQGPSGQDRSN